MIPPGDGDEREPTPTLDAVVPLMELPEGALAENGIVIISYLDHEGVASYAARELGHGDTTELIGTMMAVIHNLLHGRPPDEDPEA